MLTTSQRKAITRITAWHEWPHEIEHLAGRNIIVTVTIGSQRKVVRITPRGRVCE